MALSSQKSKNFDLKLNRTYSSDTEIEKSPSVNGSTNKTLNLGYISSVCHRVLPNITPHFSLLADVIKDKDVQNYFKNVRALQVFPGTREVFDKHGFDTSLVDEVLKESEFVKSIFLKNIKDQIGVVSNRRSYRGLCNITQSELDFVSKRFCIDVLPGHSFEGRSAISFSFPSVDMIITAINKSASAGLPDPRIKKRDIVYAMTEFMKRFVTGRLRSSDIFLYPAAIFMRLQIKESGLKVRLVHAVQAYHQLVESFYYQYFMSGVPLHSGVALGRTQREISDIVSEYDNMYTYCFDHKQWDITRQPVLSVISFELVRKCLAMAPYFDKMLVSCRNMYLTLPSFHPSIEMDRRHSGTVSGSGFTSMDNSLCNWVLMTIVMFNYCGSVGLDPYNTNYKIHVSGDDLIIGFQYPMKVELVQGMILERFGGTLVLEVEMSPPGESKAFFLGSNWIDGFPFRSERAMVASVVFGSGNFPKMSEEELFQSRFFEVFGNSSDCLVYWKKLKRRPLGTLFFFKELYTPFKTSNNLQLRSPQIKPIVDQKVDKRGYWYDISMSDSVIERLWSSR